MGLAGAGGGVGGFFTSVGAILVLFILLVIVAKAWI
ncbi:sporulation protein YjcZ [Paenibacillus xerothermodurans]|uniref:Sporulation protein YjcZ n=1 Tax=Paenibacillus xerothermodurans TaxID=1977292 RepID=A0A2W1NAV3_PAEXE|nr:sporulation protein YjcZ [Paenibacillus xerothermodurans]PZE20770.1 sporulation protein YjcZ [Paenibacillus xerothermodurans]